MEPEITPNPEATTSAPKETTKVTKRYIGITPEGFQKLMEYLDSKPYGEVAPVINSLSPILNIDVPVNG